LIFDDKLDWKVKSKSCGIFQLKHYANILVPYLFILFCF